MDSEPSQRGAQSTPNVARVYDAALGGKDNLAVDRAFVAELRKIIPDVEDGPRSNRQSLIRAVRYLAAEAGIRQFLDLGSGLPTAQNTHEVAQQVDPGARVVYVDIDPTVLAHGRALLVKNENTTVVTADIRDPAAVLESEGVRRLIDFSRPVAVLMVAVLHHLADADDPAGLVRTYLDAVPSGSYLYITHFSRDFPNAAEFEEKFQGMLGSGRFRTAEEIAGFFDGLEMLEPGIVPVPLWRPDGPVHAELTANERVHVGGMARKP